MTTKKTEVKVAETKTNLNLYQKLQQIQAEVKELIRSEENKFQKYWYFDELQVLQILKPLLDKYQLTILLSDDENKEFICEPHGNMWLVKYGKKCEIFDSDNPPDKLTYYFWASALNVDPAKAKGAAETYSIKYFLSKLFLIPVRDEEDPDRKKEEIKEEENNQSSTIKKTPPKKNLTSPATATITNIIVKLDRNKKQYLLLETDLLPNNLFVFDYKVAEERWKELSKGQTYQFHWEENKDDLLTLLDFKELN